MIDISVFQTNPWLAPVISACIAVLMFLGFIFDKLQSVWKWRKVRSSSQSIHIAPKSPIIADPKKIEPALPVHFSRSINFGVMPYIDHTYVVIAERLGWFSDLGIKVTSRCKWTC